MRPQRLAVVGALGALLLAEGIARLHGDVLCTELPGAVYTADAEVGWRFVPGARGTVGACGETSTVPRTQIAVNSHGLADPERPFAKPPHTARILLLGGNLAAGLGVRPDTILPRLLETYADRRRGDRLEVVNAGIGGFVLDNDLRYWRAEGRRFAPDLVLVLLDVPSELVALSPVLLASAGQHVPPKTFFALDADGGLVPAPPPEGTAIPPDPVPHGLPLFRRLALYRVFYRVPARVGLPLVWTEVATPGEDVVAPERDRVRGVARALLRALRDETAADGSRLVAVLAPQGGTPKRALGREVRQQLKDLTAELDIPTIDLNLQFAYSEGQRAMYIPGTSRWNGSGHVFASIAVWSGLRDQQLLPAGVVQAPLFGGSTAPTLGELPQAVVETLWNGRDTIVGRLVTWGLFAVCLTWLAAPLGAAERDWVLVVVSVGVVGALGGVTVAFGALLFAVVFHQTVERLPRTLAAVVAALLLTGLVLGTVALNPGRVADEDPGRVLFVAAASSVLFLRLVAYVADRRVGSSRRGLRDHLLAVFFFPAVVAGPIVPPEAFAAGRRVGGDDDWAARLRSAPAGLGRIALGVLALVANALLLNHVGAAVYATGGLAVGRARLWLWTLERTASFYLVLAGMTDIALGLACLVGVGLPENFAAPWAATGVADFWRRWHVSLARWLRAYVYLPLGGPSLRTVAAVFCASALWHVWTMEKVVGYQHYHPAAWTGVLGWAALSTVAVAAAHRWPASARPPRVVAAVATLVVVSLALVPAFLPGWEDARAAIPIYLRLFGFR